MNNMLRIRTKSVHLLSIFIVICLFFQTLFFVQVTYGEVSPGTSEAPLGFIDVQPNYWAYDYILWAAQEKIVVGDNHKFYPKSNVTEREFLAMIARAYKLAPKTPIKSAHWSDEFYTIASEYSWAIKGLNEKESRSSALRRKDVARIISVVAGMNLSEEDAIRYVVNSKIAVGKSITPNDDIVKAFSKDDLVTRAEITKFLYGMIRNINEVKQGTSKLQNKPELIWTKKLSGVVSHLIANGDEIYYATSTGYNGVLNTTGMTVAWQFSSGQAGLKMDFASDIVYNKSLNKVFYRSTSDRQIAVYEPSRGKNFANWLDSGDVKHIKFSNVVSDSHNNIYLGFYNMIGRLKVNSWGEQQWTSILQNESIVNALSIHDNIVYVTSNTHVYSYDLSGNLLAQHKTTSSPLNVPLQKVGSKFIVFTERGFETLGENFLPISVSDEYVFSSISFYPLVDNKGNYYITDGNKLLIMNSGSNKLQVLHSSIFGDFVEAPIAMDDQNNIVLATNKGNILSVNNDNGSLNWSMKVSDSVLSSGITFAKDTVKGNLLLTGDTNGSIYGIRLKK